MKVYHGSNQDFSRVDLGESRDKRDFGKGFYTTTIREQAESWAKVTLQKYGGAGLFVYDFDLNLDKTGETGKMRVKKFDGFTDAWFDFVLKNRTGGGTQHDYDVVQGPVANDKTTRTIALYIEGVYDKNEAIRRLQYMKANDQVSLHTEAALSYLTLVDKKAILGNRLTHNGVDITFDVMLKVEHIVRIAAQKEGRSFDEVYGAFVASKTYKTLQQVDNLYWAESAEFLADEYYREKAK